MNIAICPGSFDPVTNGHLDIIRRACALFDKVVVVVMVNASKKTLFSLEERKDFLQRATADMDNVEVDSFDGLLADYARLRGAVAVVRGLRAVSDFEYEFQMALTNRKLNPDTETVFLTTKAENLYLSSSLIKQIAGFGGDISDFVPACIMPDILEKLRRNEHG